MQNKKYEFFRKKMAAAINKNVEAGIKAASDLEGEILFSLNDELNGFSTWELPSIVAALDRYKSIILDVGEQRGKSRESIQQAADDLNEATAIAYIHKTGRAQTDEDS